MPTTQPSTYTWAWCWPQWRSRSTVPPAPPDSPTLDARSILSSARSLGARATRNSPQLSGAMLSGIGAESQRFIRDRLRKPRELTLKEGTKRPKLTLRRYERSAAPARNSRIVEKRCDPNATDRLAARGMGNPALWVLRGAAPCPPDHGKLAPSWKSGALNSCRQKESICWHGNHVGSARGCRIAS